ncbi:uncharacterized protein LOC126738257 [Anthonomus grandis grandis]|uniref:uncharacterized protein LOC126738257 n=1 Tax=Anthonomus grandis grandis TaxID=2921223 RepID=UPI0021656A5A|nr:uncharacterized protein LOC126738257 [Anthonomus grandis grandis]
MKYFEVMCLLVVVGLSDAFPKSGYYPRSYVLGGSYYSNPRYVRENTGYEYLPPGQMTAMVVGDTVATNSFSGGFIPQEPAVNPQTPDVEESVPQIIELGDGNQEQITEKQQPIYSHQEADLINETEPEEVIDHHQNNGNGEQETLFSLDEVTTETVAVSTTKLPAIASKIPAVVKRTKIGKAKRPTTTVPIVPALPAEKDDEEEDSPVSWPFGGAGRGGIPAYNAFFPIFIGGSPSARSRTRSTEGEDVGYPGSATAIANSFSTGKGGVATSHATSFGDPYAAAMMRNAGLFNFRTKSNKKQQPIHQEEDEE